MHEVRVRRPVPRVLRLYMVGAMKPRLVITGTGLTGPRRCYSEATWSNLLVSQRRPLVTVAQPLGLVHTFRLSTGRQDPITAGQSSGTQESIGIFTQPGRMAGRLPGSARIYPILCPVAGRSVSQQWCMFCL